MRTFQATSALQQLVEYMEATLSFAPNDYSAFLKQIPVDIRTGDATIRCKADANELAETTRVVVPLCLSVSERFQDRVCL